MFKCTHVTVNPHTDEVYKCEEIALPNDCFCKKHRLEERAFQAMLWKEEDRTRERNKKRREKYQETKRKLAEYRETALSHTSDAVANGNFIGA